MISHAIVFLFAAMVIWFFSGLLVESTHRLARKFNKTGFAVAFLVLGLLTSISEISVALNSLLDGVPQISAGNLAGASLVIFLLIIPFLAIFGNGIALEHSLRKRDILFSLFVTALPAFFLSNGSVDRKEGFLMMALYAALVFLIMTKKGVERAKDAIEDTYIDKLRDGAYDFVKVIVGGLLIFWSSNLLVSEALFFSDALRVPISFIGLTILSIGTNLPELVIAVRAVLKRRKDIAFGDYLGSAATNTLILGALTFSTGRFEVARGEFALTLLTTVAGLSMFYFFSQSGRRLTRKEGFALGCLYVAFLAMQFAFVDTVPPPIER